MNINLKHFSTETDLKEINPKYFAKNCFTLNDYKLSNIPRSFFYVNNSQIENRFKGQTKYTAIIDSDKLYNITENKLNIQFSNINELLTIVKRKRYLGVIYNINDLQIANIFKSIQVRKINRSK